MKKNVINIFLLALVSLGFIRPEDKKGKFHPPGTCRVNDTLYMDQTEVSNRYWLEYVEWNAKKYGPESDEYRSSLPDTTVWTGVNEPFMGFYWKHPAYADYPAVGVSYEQAMAFCAWRTERVKEYLTKSGAQHVPANFRYRLPTEPEWELAALDAYGPKIIRKQEHKYAGHKRHNLNYAPGAGTDDQFSVEITCPVQSFWPNLYGVYNCIGNVAEMTDVKGIAKGGSFRHNAGETSITRNFTYGDPENWLGFRCVFEFKEEF